MSPSLVAIWWLCACVHVSVMACCLICMVVSLHERWDCFPLWTGHWCTRVVVCSCVPSVREWCDAVPSIGVYLGRAWWAGLKHKKRARPRHDTARNILMSGRHDPIYQDGFGSRSRPMGGHEHGPLRQARNGPYRDRKGPYIYWNHTSFHTFMYLIKNTNLEIMLVRCFL
jgi:hypothetical protein